MNMAIKLTDESSIKYALRCVAACHGIRNEVGLGDRVLAGLVEAGLITLGSGPHLTNRGAATLRDLGGPFLRPDFTSRSRSASEAVTA